MFSIDLYPNVFLTNFNRKDQSFLHLIVLESSRKNSIYLSVFEAKAAQLNMRGIFLHVLSDALGSVIVIISSLVSWLVPGHDALKLYLDPGLR